MSGKKLLIIGMCPCVNRLISVKKVPAIENDMHSTANLKVYSNNGIDFAYYGYNAANTRTYKLNFLNANSWVNGQQLPIHPQSIQAMFYPNAYLNFNQSGEYTKHYYNGTERIASRLGSNTHPTDATSNDRLEYRMMREEEKFRENIQELVSDGQPVDFQGTVELNSLQPVNVTSDIFYYHTNHLGSTAFVTDNNATITQGFLYAPFGEITTEFNATFGNDIIPKYSFNAKELDEEIGMYYYEARYYKPPVFTSRDPMFEKYFWMTPYAYCANNPVKYVDPSGEEMQIPPIFPFFTNTSFLTTTPEIMALSANKTPLVRPVRTMAKNTTETTNGKPTINLQRISEGKQVEAEQLQKLGLQKNTKPYTQTDPKTGKKGTTIPDGMKDGQTTEVKNVKKLSDSKQLRLQKEVSNSNGKNPRLVINRTANISRTITENGFDIQYYNLTIPVVKTDNTRVFIQKPINTSIDVPN